MKIAFVGTGNAGSALAVRWAQKGHEVFLGVKDYGQFKGSSLPGALGTLREKLSSTP
ncbi:MAG: NAD(P)-binding domain-containing protein [Saprospiraceae bacterium]|nr:NAD(P)-binding domain-containing protein [Saprospiraceae bacterium]